MNKSVILLIFLLVGCSMTSGVMDTGNGTYLISARAAPILGGAAGANSVAYEAAQKFCVGKDPAQHAIVIDANARDVYQTSFGGSNGSFAGGTHAAGNTDLRFRCGN